MKLNYYSETDSLYIELSDKPSTESREITPDVVLDFDEDGRLIGIDMDRASQYVDLSKVALNSLLIEEFAHL